MLLIEASNQFNLAVNYLFNICNGRQKSKLPT